MSELNQPVYNLVGGMLSWAASTVLLTGRFLIRWDGTIASLAAEGLTTQIRAPRPLRLLGLYGEVTTAPGGANTTKFTLVKNGVDTTIVATITGAATSGSDTTHVVTVAAGDTLSVRVDFTGVTPGVTEATLGFGLPAQS